MFLREISDLKSHCFINLQGPTMVSIVYVSVISKEKEKIRLHI